MLLNYLYDHFLEEHDFARANDLSLAELQQLIEKRIFPAASYTYNSSGRSLSFVSNFVDETTYRFHLVGYTGWMKAIRRYGLDSEDRARTYFFDCYGASRAAFASSDLGKLLTAAQPDVLDQFNADHANATWDHFLNGVYGVCTRDGLPDSVFLKQSGVMFIEALTARGRDRLSDKEMDLLSQTVMHLDTVESEFAPHEVEKSSRQRCIIDVRETLLSGIAA